MPMVAWDDAYCVGVSEFDEHHQRLVELLNGAYDSFTSGHSTDAIEAILEELFDYATYHFTAEEAWLKEQGYPDLESHCAEHARFAAQIREIAREHAPDETVRLMEVLTFLNEWLIDHILESDAEYGRFMGTLPESRR
ncbi:bacteriohemerythrin [Geomesophilobacter sediminis]|uniref:Hemerythrin family protein n=1 Tax=Geomesophilobacter sediminis TaxID=2798584 RepID=A0A8J7S811_9BACT|nr:bacteriohemerythrin [Geomesophilobacter sediminis]MBJ6727361.1 hemerythrin family protein [Geomesophilobacter sediminis]